MSALLTIGDFSRLTHVSVKALRHYHEVGLLPPVTIDPASGYRFYAAAQAPTAQLIRRFRDMKMPLDQIRGVLSAANPDERDQIIIAHLASMERELGQTQMAVASLRALLEGGGPAPAVEVRTLRSTRALVCRDRVAWDDAEGWLRETLVELRGHLDDGAGMRAGPDGGLYSEEFFEAHVGPVTAFIPVDTASPVDSASPASAELAGGAAAVTLHKGRFEELDRVYAALGTFVAERAVGISGPIRENYVVSMLDTTDDDALVTEVCWPTVPPAA